MKTLYLYNENRIFSGSKEVADGISYPNSTEVAPPSNLVVPKWFGISGGWQEYVPPVVSYIKITTDKEIYDVNETVTVDVRVYNSKNETITITETYYVPVIRQSDNFQVDFLTIDVIDGLSNFTFTVPSKGQYSISLDKITPKPSVRLASNVSIIVK